MLVVARSVKGLVPVTGLVAAARSVAALVVARSVTGLVVARPVTGQRHGVGRPVTGMVAARVRSCKASNRVGS